MYNDNGIADATNYIASRQAKAILHPLDDVSTDFGPLKEIKAKQRACDAHMAMYDTKKKQKQNPILIGIWQGLNKPVVLKGHLRVKSALKQMECEKRFHLELKSLEHNARKKALNHKVEMYLIRFKDEQEAYEFACRIEIRCSNLPAWQKGMVLNEFVSKGYAKNAWKTIEILNISKSQVHRYRKDYECYLYAKEWYNTDASQTALVNEARNILNPYFNCTGKVPYWEAKKLNNGKVPSLDMLKSTKKELIENGESAPREPRTYKQDVTKLHTPSLC